MQNRIDLLEILWKTNTICCCYVRARHHQICCAAAFVRRNTLPTCGDRQALKVLLKSPDAKEIRLRSRARPMLSFADRSATRLSFGSRRQTHNVGFACVRQLRSQWECDGVVWSGVGWGGMLVGAFTSHCAACALNLALCCLEMRKRARRQHDLFFLVLLYFPYYNFPTQLAQLPLALPLISLSIVCAD